MEAVAPAVCSWLYLIRLASNDAGYIFKNHEVMFLVYLGNRFP